MKDWFSGWLRWPGRNGRQKDMAFLSDAAQLLQACRTIAEVSRVARDRLQSISPRLSGALYLMSETDEYLENVMTWGTIEASSLSFAPSDCWALRCGRPHQTGKRHDATACAHTDATLGDWHMCVPLVAQGEALGVLHYRLDPGAGRRSQDLIGAERLHFYCSVAETLSLAVANIRLRESLQQQAIRDPLTGLFNRRYMEETLRREMHRAARALQPLSFVMIDVDHFKGFNDAYGHDAGDAALKAVGGILMGRSRAGDVACRYGGEEFALALPGVSGDVAAARVEEIRREIELRDIRFHGRTIDAVTISAGIATYPGDAMDTDSLIRAADQALYRSKEAGRNRVTIVGERTHGGSVTPLSLVHSTSLGVAREETARRESRPH